MPPTPEQDLTEVVAVRMQPASLARLNRMAAKMDRSASWCIRRAILEWLDRQDRKAK